MEQNEFVLKVEVDTEEVAQNLADATKRVAELKAEQKRLTEVMKTAEGATVENAKALASVKGELNAVSREVKSSTALLQAETIARIDDNSSLDEQRQALNAAQKAYALLTGEEKKAADAAGGLRDQIARLSDHVKDQEAKIGDARRNVGNYAMQTAEAANKMGFFGRGIAGVVNPIKNMTAGLKAASATPFIAIISLAITILTKLADRFKGNSAALEKLTGVFGVFSGAANIVNVIIDKIAEGIGWIAEKALELAEKLGLLTDSMKAGQKIAQDELALQKEAQAAALKTAEDQRKIAQLRADAAKKDKYTSSHRLAMLQEASDLEEGIAQRTYDLAKKEYDLQVLRNKQSNSSQEELKKENDLRIAMINAETALFNKQRELNSQMAKLRKEENAAIQADLAERNRLTREAAIQRMEDLRLLALAELAAEEQQIKDMQEKSRELLVSLDESEEDEDIPTLDEMALKMFGLDSAGVEYFRSLLEQGVSFADAKTMAIADQTKRMASSFASSFGNLGDAFSQMGDMLGEYADQSKGAAAAQKAFAFSGILLNQAQSISEGALAIAKGVESASAIPFPGNIPAIISIVAQITSMLAGVGTSIAQAKNIFSQADAGSFATGGVVGGTSYTGDKLIAHVNSGEMILPQDKAEILFDALSGSQNSGTLGVDYDMLAAAIAAQPAPVLVYTELEQFGQRMADIKEIASV